MNFGKERYNTISDVFEQWWDHRLTRPVIQVTLIPDLNKEGNLFTTDFRRRVLEAMYDRTMSPEEVAECVASSYEDLIYLGDAFPVFYIRPTGVLGGFLGQNYGVDHDHGTVWFEKTDQELSEIAGMELDPEDPLLIRCIEITKAVQDRFDGAMGLGFPDLGGVCDVAASIRDSNKLLLDLYENEDEVKRVLENIHTQFFKAYDLFDAVIDSERIPGYTAWASMLSAKPYFVLQNDFSAMISPEMYDEFYLPILQKECRAIPRTLYHLDGPGAVRHLPSILTVKELDAVQWINGAGAPGLDQWPDIYKKVFDAGKLCQVFINGSRELRYIDDLIRMTGYPEGFCFICNGSEKEREAFEEYLRKYDIK